MNFEAMSQKAIVEEMGQRLRRERLNQDIAQGDLARHAGISRRTLQKMEAGEICTLDSLVRVLRSLGKLCAIDAFLPPVGISMLQLAQRRGRERQRASGLRRTAARGPRGRRVTK